MITSIAITVVLLLALIRSWWVIGKQQEKIDGLSKLCMERYFEALRAGSDVKAMDWIEKQGDGSPWVAWQRALPGADSGCTT